MKAIPLEASTKSVSVMGLWPGLVSTRKTRSPAVTVSPLGQAVVELDSLA